MFNKLTCAQFITKRQVNTNGNYYQVQNNLLIFITYNTYFYFLINENKSK